MMASRHLGMLYLFFIAIIGVIFGTVYIQLLPHAVMSELLEQWGSVFSQGRILNGTYDVLWSYFLYQCQYLILMFLLGLSIIGYPIVLVMHFFKAFLFGASIQLFISLWGEEAWTYVFIWILPSTIFILLATIMFCTALGRYCGSFITLIKQKKWEYPLRKLFKPFIFSMIMIFLGAISQTYISPYIFQYMSTP